MDNHSTDRMLMQNIPVNPYSVSINNEEFDKFNAMFDIQKPNQSRDVRRTNQNMPRGPPQMGNRYHAEYFNVQPNNHTRNQYSYTLQPTNSMAPTFYGQHGSIAPMSSNIIQDTSMYYPTQPVPPSQMFNVDRQQQQHILSPHSYSVPSHMTSITNSPYKRKYKKHPKKDPNAPEKWKSAYQLFRDDINKTIDIKKYSFVDLSKIHSEQWSGLNPQRKKHYEDLAKTAKIDYEKQMNIYRKSKQFKDYEDYLAQFYAQEDTVGRVGRPKGKKTSNSSSSMSANSSSNQMVFQNERKHFHHNIPNFPEMNH
ncbi:hypothetical protein BB558_004587 [Smittium angustum]|uniref:HMG box domain-containing protein n=1 Tax=Smittium angustum TaxID=133377 RepID=A0A2U1J2V9_SMIAN|nr:hypothetical protein BB558_006449 [Smittium angustum]PVZ99400.1 hypothetical protein BB558_004587 [Smittium angustum]